MSITPTVAVASLTTMFSIADASFRILATIDTAFRPLDMPTETIFLLPCTGLRTSDSSIGLELASSKSDSNILVEV